MIYILETQSFLLRTGLDWNNFDSIGIQRQLYFGCLYQLIIILIFLSYSEFQDFHKFISLVLEPQNSLTYLSNKRAYWSALFQIENVNVYISPYNRFYRTLYVTSDQGSTFFVQIFVNLVPPLNMQLSWSSSSTKRVPWISVNAVIFIQNYCVSFGSKCFSILTMEKHFDPNDTKQLPVNCTIKPCIYAFD